MTAADYYARHAKFGRAYFEEAWADYWLVKVVSLRSRAVAFLLCCGSWLHVQHLEPGDCIDAYLVAPRADLPRQRFARTHRVQSDAPVAPGRARKLTEAERRELVRLHEEHAVSYPDLGSRFGIAPTTVGAIVQAAKRQRGEA